MRHKNKFNHLARTSAHRHALLSNMAASLILHKRIKTTEAKAKALRLFVEPLVTKAKKDTLHTRSVVFSRLQNKYAVTELFSVVVPKVGDRPGGYTRILKLGRRLGDDAMEVIMEFVDFNEERLKVAKSASEAATKTRRSRRKKSNDQATEVVKNAEKMEKVEATEQEVLSTEGEQPSLQKMDEEVTSSK